MSNASKLATDIDTARNREASVTQLAERYAEDAVQLLRRHLYYLDGLNAQEVSRERLCQARDAIAYVLGRHDLSGSEYRDLEMWHRFAKEQTDRS